MKLASAVRTGGKGSVRRKKKAIHKTTTTYDKRLQKTLKRLGVNSIPRIEEVNIFKDETVIHFPNPKVQASIATNTWVISGASQTKKLQELLPSIINQLGMDNSANLKRITQQYHVPFSLARSPAVHLTVNIVLHESHEISFLLARCVRRMYMNKNIQVKTKNTRKFQNLIIKKFSHHYYHLLRSYMKPSH